MKRMLITTLLLSALAISMPGRADCPLSQDGKKTAPAAKHESAIKTAVKPQKLAPEPEPSWHDLHWFE
jgi:hypothetical protein